MGYPPKMKPDRVEFDVFDRRLLAALQADASISMSALGEIVGLSANAVWRRVKLMEEAGVIRGRVALLSPEALGLDLTVFVSVKTNQHTAEWLDRFAKGVAAIPEVVEFHRMAGEWDYLIKLHVSTVADYDRVYRRLIATAPLSDVSSSFAMETIKATTALPVPDR